jgi:hypothetical protein
MRRPGRRAPRAALLADPGHSNSTAMQHLFARVIEETWQVRRTATSWTRI